MSASDPSGFVRNPPSIIVKVQNTSQDTVNGKFGIVVSFNVERGRYLVHMTENQQTIALKPENLVKASTLEQVQAQYQQLSRDPNVRREITKYYNLAASKLPPGVKPEQAGIGLLVALLLVMYFVGFTRVLMLISMVLILGLILGPDLAPLATGAPVDWRMVASNFPRRCRTVIEQSFPMLEGKLSDQVAAGLVAFFLLMSAKAVVSRSGAKAAAAAASSASATTKAASIEEAYRFGFNDANAGKAYGTSLPQVPPVMDPIFDNNIPRMMRPKPWYSKLGIWQIFGLFNIGRTINEMGRDAHGGFSPQLAIANLQQADAMRLGLLGYSVYNVLKVFF